MKRYKLLLLPIILAVFILVPMLTMGAYWVQNVGLLSADAMVFASDAPAIDRFMASAMKHLYGARVQVCDGTADETEFMAVATDLGTNGLISASSGNFYIGAAITGSWSGIHLQGAGQAATTFNQAYAGDVFDISCYQAVFNDFQVIGDHATYASGSGMKMALNESILRNILIKEFAECGIESDSAGARILTQYVAVRAVNNEQYGMKLTSFDRDSLMQGCSFSGNLLDGFYSEGWGHRFIGNWISDCGGHGIYARAPIWVESGNEIQDNGEEGVHLFGVSGGSRSAIITGNNFMDNGQTTDNTYYSIQIETSVTANTNWIDHITIAENHFVCYTAANQAAGHIYFNGHKSNYRDTTINNNTMNWGDTGPIKDAATFGVYGILVKDNQGYIAPGEIRTYAITLTAGAEHTVTYIQNPFTQAVWVAGATFNLTTAATASNPTYDVALDADGAGVPDGAALITGAVDTVGTYLSWNDGAGAWDVQTAYVNLAAAGGASDYIGICIQTAAGADSAGVAYITLMGQ